MCDRAASPQYRYDVTISVSILMWLYQYRYWCDYISIDTNVTISVSILIWLYQYRYWCIHMLSWAMDMSTFLWMIYTWYHQRIYSLRTRRVRCDYQVILYAYYYTHGITSNDMSTHANEYYTQSIHESYVRMTWVRENDTSHTLWLIEHDSFSRTHVILTLSVTRWVWHRVFTHVILTSRIISFS